QEEAVEEAHPFEAVGRVQPPRLGAVGPPDVLREHGADPGHLAAGAQKGAGARKARGGPVRIRAAPLYKDVAHISDITDAGRRGDLHRSQVVPGFGDLLLQTVFPALRPPLRTAGRGILLEFSPGGPGT